MSPARLRRLLPATAAVAALAALAAFQASPGQANSFAVTRFDDPPPNACSPGDCSLREAVIAANASPGPDVIDLASGVYTLGIAGPSEDAAASGDLDLNGDLTISGEGPAATAIDGGGLDRVFDVTGSHTVDISRVTVRAGDSGGQDGGGIRNVGTLTLTEVIVRENHADDAAGINNMGTLTLAGSSVSGNEADDAGGGVFNRSGATLTLTDSAVSGNSSGFGAGGISNFETLTLTNSTVSGNTTGGSGGGISNFGDATLTNSTLSGNATGVFDGGGISNEGTLTLTSSTLSDNRAGGSGGGINNYQGTVTLKNTIIANSTPGGDCAGDAIASDGHNLDSDGTCGLAAGGDLSGIDPQLGSLAGNGGPTLTHTLLPGSPAIDAGSGDCPPPDTDQRGIARPLDGDGVATTACDIGAVEVGPYDSDNDGCIDEREAGQDLTLGGQRDPNWFWDVYDVPTGAGLVRDGSVAGEDIFGVIGRFNATDVGPGDFDRYDDPLTIPNPADPSGTTEAYRQNYHPAYDRGELVGPNAWDLGSPDGAIASQDIFGVIAQFGLSCS